MRRVEIVNNAGGKEFFHAGKEGGLSEVFEDARGFDEIHTTTLLTGEENQVVSTSERKEEIRWVVAYDSFFILFLDIDTDVLYEQV